MEAVRARVRVGAGSKLELISDVDLPEGEAEIILLYDKSGEIGEGPRGTGLSPLNWPTLDGGRFLGGTLRRQEIYDDNGR